ncbi:hypothetical protein [Acidaminococcus fermentans]|jgi:hypothetical protein|uniref:DUF3887 domain-containing protein n=1 Tax=Acidaminococcus fermentans TaxID=905 RepID=A0A6N7VMZ8_ACIFE|nr:hypothetical protein [Acidaminococcus fermentans]MSS83069.1 hypothetical protein [Acidaminococcus fermentans]
MKKIILMLTAVLSLGMASLGFASPASDLLAQEETTTSNVIKLIQGKGQLAEVSTGFSPALQKNFNAAALDNMKKGVTEQLGGISNLKLVRLDKFADADRLVYIGDAKKAPNVQMTFVFSVKGKKAELQGLNLIPVEVKQVQNNQKEQAK